MRPVSGRSAEMEAGPPTTSGPLTDVAQGADACDATIAMQNNAGSSASPSWKE